MKALHILLPTMTDAFVSVSPHTRFPRTWRACSSRGGSSGAGVARAGAGHDGHGVHRLVRLTMTTCAWGLCLRPHHCEAGSSMGLTKQGKWTHHLHDDAALVGGER